MCSIHHKEEIERCGYCGEFFIGTRYLIADELNEINDNVFLDNVPLGYCPNAQAEHEEQNPES